MTKKIHHDLSKVNKIPQGVPFVQLSYELINSPAWCSRSINCIRLINFLMLENMRHKGLENGSLIATYDQLVNFGIGRSYINKAICEAVQLGLIEVKHGINKGYANSDCNRFTITFCAEKRLNFQLGSVYYVEASNLWKRITYDDVKNWKQGEKLYKQNSISNSRKENSHST